jgi:uncharacterized protein YjiS (DUF1127 family)
MKQTKQKWRFDEMSPLRAVPTLQRINGPSEIHMNTYPITAGSAKSASFRSVASRRYRSGKGLRSLLRKVAAIVKRALLRYRQRQQSIAIYHALNELDNRTLHDLGFDRSEITSVAAEVTGEAEYSRVRSRLSLHGLPR